MSESLRKLSALAGRDLSAILKGTSLAELAGIDQSSTTLAKKADEPPRGASLEAGSAGIRAIRAAELESAAIAAGADAWIPPPAPAPKPAPIDWEQRKAAWAKQREDREAAKAAAFKRKMQACGASDAAKRVGSSLGIGSSLGSVLSASGPPAAASEPAAAIASSAPAPAEQSASSAPAAASSAPIATKHARTPRAPLTQNPRKLKFHRDNTAKACAALHAANAAARKGSVSRLEVPRQVGDLLGDMFDCSDAVAGALDWVRRTHGPGIAIEVEASALYRERVTIPRVVGVQHDDWSEPRARRKAALLVFLLMSPHELARHLVTGSPSDEPLLVTAGVPQTLLIKLLHSAQREPYCVRTLQRDLAEIEACTDLLLRWKTPVAHAEEWERRGNAKGVINRYCVRAGMVREQWRRARDAGEAFAKQTMLRCASWMVWQPPPLRGSPVSMAAGCTIIPAPS